MGSDTIAKSKYFSSPDIRRKNKRMLTCIDTAVVNVTEQRESFMEGGGGGGRRACVVAHYDRRKS